jgi:hypoxanthine phosphoribosyltransferase
MSNNSTQAFPVVVCCWQEFDNLTEVLTRHIRADGLPDIIVGLERGGLIPAVALSHRLEVRSLLSLAVRRTTSDAIDAEKCPPCIGRPPSHFSVIPGRDILVVDDIAGSGETLEAVLRMLTNWAPARLRSVVYFVNRNNWETRHTGEPAHRISYIGKEVRGWVIFPWEKENHG